MIAAAASPSVNAAVDAIGSGVETVVNELSDVGGEFVPDIPEMTDDR